MSEFRICAHRGFRTTLTDGLSRYSADFLAGLATLPDHPGPGAIPAYLKFIDTFGTHVPAQIAMGGIASLWSEFSQEDYDRMATENIDLEQVRYR